MARLKYKKQLDRLIITTDNNGLIQHSQHSIPDLKHGYSVDDVARGLIILSRVYPNYHDNETYKDYLDYIRTAQRSDGFFHNFRYKNGDFKVEGHDLLQDCYGRVIWSLSEFIKSKYPETKRQEAEKMLFESLETAGKIEYNYSKAFALLGLTQYQESYPDEKIKKIIKNYSDSLSDNYLKHSDKKWKWFSDIMTYCNARLPQAMILSGKVLDDKKITEIGIESLNFLGKTTLRFKRDENNRGMYFHAIGNRGWFKKEDEKPADYDEQTVEAGDMADCCFDAYKITKKNQYLIEANLAQDWFSGRNSKNLNMIEEILGGVYDAITLEGANINQGAESLISYLFAATGA